MTSKSKLTTLTTSQRREVRHEHADCMDGGRGGTSGDWGEPRISAADATLGGATSGATLTRAPDWGADSAGVRGNRRAGFVPAAVAGGGRSGTGTANLPGKDGRDVAALHALLD